MESPKRERGQSPEIEALLDSALDSANALEVREKVLSHFGYPTDLNASPAPLITPEHSEVLREAVDRWNKMHPISDETTS